MSQINPEEIDVILRYIAEISGISLDESKVYLIEARLNGLVKQYGCASYAALCQQARSDTTKSIESKIIDAITTRETSFFRDIDTFNLLQRKVLADLIEKRSSQSPGFFPSPIRIWSAGCSAGQEVYSIIIVLKELIPDLNKLNVRVLGTDISEAALAKARDGRYNEFEVQRGGAKARLQKYLIPDGSKRWKISDEIRALASFKRQNLIEPFTDFGRFDIVLCRNVAIYFALGERARLFNKIAEVLEPNGYLIIGATESLIAVCKRFERKAYLGSFFYQLVE
jgi:chemotaxis protein methyltransferase CheR